MSAKDRYHDAVRNALIKEGWTITHDPYYIRVGRKKTFIDLGAELPLAAEKGERKIAVEIKSFLGQSELDELEKALGQYSLYRVGLKKNDPERLLYLAVPESLRELLVEERDFQDVLAELWVRLIIYNSEKEVINEWIEPPNIAPLSAES